MGPLAAEPAQRERNSTDAARIGATFTHAFTAEQVAAMVIEARARVTGTAARHPRFTGLSEDDVEELFDATSEVVVGKHGSYANAEHVRASLWRGMELRALDVFRRRGRRGLELDPALLELVPDDTGVREEDRISDAQELLVVQDFLAALAPREADVWKLVHGEDLSVVQTAKRLGMSRHATGEHLDAAARKLEIFIAIRQAGEWCGRRETDILRLIDGADDEGTARRAIAHLQACGVCRRAYAAQVRRTGHLAAGVLPMPVLLDADHGRSLLERLLDLLPVGGGSGRTEVIGGALLGGGGGLAGVAKVGAVVATTATVAVGAGTVVVDRATDRPRTSTTPAAAAPSLGAAAAPEPIAQVVRAPSAPPRTTPTKTAQRAKRAASNKRAEAQRAAARQKAAERREDVFELGTVESAGPSNAAAAASAPASGGGGPTAPAPDPPGQETFLP